MKVSLAISFQQDSRFHNFFASWAVSVAAFSFVHSHISFLFLFYLWAVGAGLTWNLSNILELSGRQGWAEAARDVISAALR